MKDHKLITFASLLLCVMFCSAFGGCSTYAKRLQAPHSSFYANDLEACTRQLEKIHSSHRSDRDCLDLDLSIVNLAQGHSDVAEKKLRGVRDRFDFLEQKSLAESTVAYLTDERSKAYSGEDYEKILLHGFLALSNLFHDGTDAESYTLQLDEKQQQIADKFASEKNEHRAANYPVVPFGFYLRGVLREATFHDYDEATANYQQVCGLLPGVRQFDWDLQRASHGVHSNRGHGVLYVFALVGRGPSKIAQVEEPTSDALLIADRIISAAGPFTLPPTIAPIQVPAVQINDSAIETVLVQVDQTKIGTTDTIANVEQLAMQAYEINHADILARAIARRVVKKATVVVAKDSMHADPLVSLAMDAAGVAWEATEKADTRGWSLLPREIQVMRIEMPIGTHQVSLLPIGYKRPIGPTVTQQIDILDGANTYVMGYFPDNQLVGKLSVSGLR